MEFNVGWLEIIVLDVAALVTIISFLWARDKKRQAEFQLLTQRYEDKYDQMRERLDDHKKYTTEQYQQLSADCLRREELIPIQHSLSEIRHRIDDLFTSLQRNKK